jgi:hypothetical protein
MKTLTIKLKRTSRIRIEQLTINELKRLKIFRYIEAFGGWYGELSDEQANGLITELKRLKIEVEER